MAVSASKFVDKTEYVHSTYKVTYKNGTAGSKTDGIWYCDCRGLIVWVLRLLGLSISCPGTNWMIRNQMTSVGRVSSVSELTVGQVVFKSRTSIDKLPDKYKIGGANYDSRFGELDVYHVGIVVQTSPSLIIRHCTSGGILTDTKLGAWCWAGWVKYVAPDGGEDVGTATPDEAETAVVTAAKGKTVNLRKAASLSAVILKRVPIGDTVTMLTEGVDWCRVSSDGITGFMMTEFLERG